MSKVEKRTGLRRLYYAGVNSVKGIYMAAKGERAFMQELILVVILVPLAVILEVGAERKMLLIGSLMGVLVVELLNSAIEGAVDYISEEYHELARRIKDMASGAVLLSLIIAGVMWGWTVVELVF